MRVRQQMRNLRLQSARIDDLAQRSVRRQRQQIPRDIEGPRLQRALVRILLHLGRLRRDADQILSHVRRKRFVLREQKSSVSRYSLRASSSAPKSGV